MLREGSMIDAHRVTLAAPDDFDGWRERARDLAEAGVSASAVVWRVEGGPPNSLYRQGIRPESLPPGTVVVCTDCNRSKSPNSMNVNGTLRLPDGKPALGVYVAPEK